MDSQLSAATTAAPAFSAPPAQPAAPAPSLSRGKRWLFSGILLLLVLGLGELAASVFLRVTRGYDGRHLYQYDYDAYKNILPARNYVDTRGIVHNAQGFRRTTNVSVVKAPGAIRVFIMGGSTAYGLGGLWPFIQRDYAVLKNAETIDSYLENELRKAFPGRQVEVINAAITSTWTHHSFIYINQSILKYHPDMVLFLDGYNDYYFDEPGHDQFASYAYNNPAEVIMGAPTIKSLMYANGWWLFRKSALFHVLGRAAQIAKQAVTPKPAQPPIPVDSAIAGIQRNFPKDALKMHRRSGLILLDEGVVPVFMLQPMLILERARLTTMPPIERKLFEFDVSSQKPNVETFYRRAVDVVRADEEAMTKEIGAQYIDLTGIYAGAQGQMFTDYVHLTPRANEILAGEVAKRIEPLLAARLASGCAEGSDSIRCRNPRPANPVAR